MTLCNPTPESTPDLPEGVPALISFYLYLTTGCNLCCRHCWIEPSFTNSGEPAPGEYLDIDWLRRAVAEAKPLGLQHAKLTGGEPMLHPQFIEVVDFLSAEGLGLNIETNGTLIDAKLALHLKDHTRLEHIAVSIDGPTAQIHDPFRGVEGSFAAATRGFQHLTEAGFHPQLIMSLHQGNVQYVKDVVSLAVKLGAGSVKFNPVTHTGRGSTMHERGETLGFEEIMKLAHFIRGDLQQQTPIPLILSTPPALYTVKELIHGDLTTSCQVRHTLGILGSGEMALCGIGRTIPELCFGTLQETSVTDVWFNHSMLQQLRRELDEEYPGVCRQCIHAKRCLTWCVALNYQDTGRLVSPAWLCVEAYARGAFPDSRLQEKP